MTDVPKRADAKLYPSEVVTLALLFALKGVGNHAFYRWLTRDSLALFPALSERTRLFRLFKTHTDWTIRFLAEPTVLGVADSFGIELIHPMREGRSPHQIGKKGKSDHRWIVGGKLCFIRNQWGLICGWDCATAVETVLSLLTNVFHSKQMHHRVWDYFRARLAWTMAAFNILAQRGMEIDDNDMVRLSIAEFSL